MLPRCNTGKTQQNNHKYATAVLLRTWQRFYDNTTFINTQQRPWSWFRMSPFMCVFNMSTCCDRDKDSTPIRTSWNFMNTLRILMRPWQGFRNRAQCMYLSLIRNVAMKKIPHDTYFRWKRNAAITRLPLKTVLHVFVQIRNAVLIKFRSQSFCVYTFKVRKTWWPFLWWIHISFLYLLSS